jgi:hypothetical protein
MGVETPESIEITCRGAVDVRAPNRASGSLQGTGQIFKGYKFIFPGKYKTQTRRTSYHGIPQLG